MKQEEPKDNLRERFYSVFTEARLHSIQAVEDVLDIYESVFYDDKRPRRAVEAARKVALGELDSALPELYAARIATEQAYEYEYNIRDEPEVSDKACLLAEAARAVAMAAEWVAGGYFPPFAAEDYAARARELYNRAKAL